MKKESFISYYEDLQKIGITYFIGAQYRNNGYAAEAAKAYTQNRNHLSFRLPPSWQMVFHLLFLHLESVFFEFQFP